MSTNIRFFMEKTVFPAIAFTQSYESVINRQIVINPHMAKGRGIAFIILWANSADDKLTIFFLFSQKTGFDISCTLSLLQIVSLHNMSNLVFWEK